MPYSCQLQFGTSGKSTCPVGAGITWRAIGREMSQTSKLTMVQTITRAPPGRVSLGRSTMAENDTRSLGIVGLVMIPNLGGQAAVVVHERTSCSASAEVATNPNAVRMHMRAAS